MKHTKILSASLAAAMLLGLAAPAYAEGAHTGEAASAEEATVATFDAASNTFSFGYDISWTLADDGTLTLSGSGTTNDYGSSASPFRDMNVTRLVVGEGITRIGSEAFSACEKLESVSLPSTITEMGSFAFYKCPSLTSVSIPEGITALGYAVFHSCYNLNSIYIPKSVAFIGNYAFYFCESLKDVYYAGSEEDWANIEIGLDNEMLTSANIHYNSAALTPSPDENGTIDAAGVEGFVDRLYSVCLGREADAAGKADWVGQLTSYQISGTKAAYGFIFSEEFTNMNYSNADFVEQLYQAFMGRASDEGGKADWVGKLDAGTSREDVFSGFANSVEFDNICKSYGIVSKDIETFVTRLYSVCLDRQPDDAGLADWAGRLRSGAVTGKAAASGFVFSEEFTNKNYSNADYVEHLYAAFMGRTSDEAGKTDWVGKLDAGTSREEVFNGFADSAEFDNICSSYGIVRG